ncbi:MAG: hypothetical protein M0R06_20185 [Sphaerochaeta sp.]|jgi:hypothetical protein|nr:hypothetical protein [Sphaerochaeta sp.]
MPPEEITEEINIVEDVKELRLNIAEVTNRARTISTNIARGLGGRELALVITKLQEAKMWAGKMLEEIGNPLPEEFRDEPKA